MGYLQSKLVADHCVDELARSCAPRVFRRARQSVSQSGAARPCSTPPGCAREGPIASYVLQSAASADRADRVPAPWVYRGAYHHRTFVCVCVCEEPSIACVSSQVV